VVRTASSAYGPSAGLPMFSDLAIPVGLTGATTSQPFAKAVTIGEQPADCAPNIRTGKPSDAAGTSPAAMSSLNDLCTLVSSEPDAIGATTWGGIRQPNCSATS